MSPKRALFVQHYLIKPNATWAAEQAGFSKHTAKSQGQRLLTFDDVKAAIAAGQQKRAAKLEVKADDVLRELQTFAHLDPAEIVDDNGHLLPLKQMPINVRRAIASVEIEEIWEGKGDEREQVGELKKVKFWNKKDGLELLGKHISLFGESTNTGVTNVFQVTNNQLTVNLDYTRLTVEEHRQLAALLDKASPPAPKE